MAYEKTKAKIMYINKVREEEKVMRKRIRGNNVPAIVNCRNDTFETIIGREVLNRFVIVLDGKRLSIEVRDP